MVVAVVVDVVAEKGAVEGYMVITHINSPSGTEHLWQRYVYTLHTNGGFPT